MNKYDHVISLGGYCIVAQQLKRMGLRDASYPFDWAVTEDHNGFCKLLKNGISDWCLLENLEEVDAAEPHHRTVIDHKYNFRHQHIFPTDRSVEEAYDDVLAIQHRRIDRLLSLKGQKLLFVRSRCSDDEAKEILALLKPLFGDNIKLLIVNFNKDFSYSTRWLTDEICVADIYDENEHTGQKWSGYDKHWDRLRFELIGSKPMKRRLKDLAKKLITVRRLEGRCSDEEIYNLENYGGNYVTMYFSAIDSTPVSLIDVYGNPVVDEPDVSGKWSVKIPVEHKNRYVKLRINPDAKVILNRIVINEKIDK